MRAAVISAVGICLVGGVAHAANRPGYGLLGPAAQPRGLVARAAADGCFNPATSEDIRNALRLGAKCETKGGVSASASDDEPPTGAPSTGVTHQTRRPAADFPLEFRSGSAALSAGAMAKLRQLGEVLQQPEMAGLRFRIEGHTDTVGADDTNLELSRQRAAAVAEFLQNACHIDAHRLEAVGVGKKDLAVDTPDQTPNPRNRFVRIIRL